RTGPRSAAGQQQEPERQKLKISNRLDALAARDKDQLQLENPVRAKVVQIDKMLEVIEARLSALYRHEVDESLRGDGFKELDVKLGDIEGFVTDLNTETQNTAFEFVGLQMIDISSSHVTPARDAVFVAIRKPDSGADVHAEEALHHVVSARELLLALLRKYDSVAKEKELAKKIDEAIKMYTVFVEGTQQLLAEAQQTFDPLKLQRDMAVVEVDQAYLDRLAEVTRMRRDMMSELAKILGDDPRLRSRYLDLIKRRRASLRSQLGELAARLEQSAQEVMGWLSVSENQRENYWLQVSDLRLDLPKELAREAQQFADRVEKQMPLVLEASQGTAARTIQLAKQIALDIRRCDFEVRELRKTGEAAVGSNGLSTSAGDLVYRIGELAAALDELNFDGQGQEGVEDYVRLRMSENCALADQADMWAATAAAIEQKLYSGLAYVEQQQITISTELLRMEMLNIEADLAGQFNEENPMPQEIINLTQDKLHATCFRNKPPKAAGPSLAVLNATTVRPTAHHLRSWLSLPRISCCRSINAESPNAGRGDGGWSDAGANRENKILPRSVSRRSVTRYAAALPLVIAYLQPRKTAPARCIKLLLKSRTSSYHRIADDGFRGCFGFG
ncbi:MAG: hypothetical protein WKF77_18245, partial [Planctomycetaceae bacterium]